MCDQQRLRSACAYRQSDQSLCLSLEYFTTVQLLTEHNSERLSLTGGCTGLSESTLVKRPHCWKSHVTAKLYFVNIAWVSLVNRSMSIKIDVRSIELVSDQLYLSFCQNI